MKDYASLPKDSVRRNDRQQDDTWVRDFLTHAPVGTLATVHEDQPFVNMNLFVYDADKHVIWLHTARVGRTLANLEVAPQVCFSVYEMGRLLPADEALEFSVEYASVVVFGQAVEEKDPATGEYALQLLLDKYAPHLRPGDHYRPITADELKRTGVIRLDIETWTGKQKKVETDFPGAFWYNVG